MKCFRIAPFLFVLLISLLGCSGGGGGELAVVTAIITVDGDPSDWEQTDYAKPIYHDDVGDVSRTDLRMDIISVYVAQDSENIYVRFDLLEGPPSGRVGIGMSFVASRGQDEAVGDRFISADIEPAECSVWVVTSEGSSKVGDGEIAFQGNVIEFSVKRADVNPPSPCFVSAWTYLRDDDDVFDNTGGAGVPVAL